MLEEAIDVLRLLWQGGYQSHQGRHYVFVHQIGPEQHPFLRFYSDKVLPEL
jgi:alkanesulfonate monooxygenase SsuD/methylene tetrahydromethanopterin reductase-like flavin-dependent oxidoreductase (luciferase family)